MEKDTYIVIDIGGTSIKYGLIRNEQIYNTSEMETMAHLGGKNIVKNVFSIIDGFLNENPKGVCISTAGMVDYKTGLIFHASPLIPNYQGTNFVDLIKDKYNLPCTVENDVNCAGLGEYYFGASKGCESAITLTIGTGIGGSFIFEGKVYHGFSNSAMEIGYINMNNSTYESLGATSILSKKVAKVLNGTKEYYNGKRIFSMAKEGNETAIKSIDEMVEVIAKGIANIVYVLNPEIVVLGGGVMAQKEYIEPILQKYLDKYLIETINKNTKIAFASAGNNAGMLGAYCNFKLFNKL